MKKRGLSKKYDRVAVERKWKKFWRQEKIFEFSFDKKKPLYVVDTPPPYVSADHLHSGHIMSYAQAEFIVRYRRMKGFNVFYPMGFDDNGLPTERFVEKKYKIDKSKITRSEFIKICLKETAIGAKTYKKLWDDLGISVDWTKTYSTINPLATKVSQWSLVDLYKKKFLYRSEAPALWCPFCRTALAQADLEDKKKVSKMNYINFKLLTGREIAIATTRPELLPACVALFAHPDDKRYKMLFGKKATVPLFGHNVPVLASAKVDMDFGTGLMMVCTWGDKEDLEKWQIHKLDTRALITDNGRLNELGGKYKGLTLAKARREIVADLKRRKILVKEEETKHNLNIHERCGTPTEFILSKQWFIKIAALKNVWLDYGEKLNWYPRFRRKDYESWIRSIKWDWCVSRQRYYGVPFPVWYCGDCDEPVFAQPDKLPVNPLEDKPERKSCRKCGGKTFVPETDVLDTWATSSCTPFMLKELVKKEKVKARFFPVSLRPNAFEIIRTWDFYSIVKSHYHFGKLPFKDIMISGHGVDEKGKKISKRLGNYVASDKLLNDFGADAIRYWATGASLGKNLRFSIEEIKKGKKTTIKLWNVARFILINLEEVELIDDFIGIEYADSWIIKQANEAIKKTTEAFEAYDYVKARNQIETLFWSLFADYYLEFIKYRLAKNGSSKRAARATLVNVFLAILKMYAPILPFVTEEIYQMMFKDRENKKSIHLSSWPELIKAPSLEVADFSEAIAVVDEIRKYKSTRGMSLGAELEKFETNLPVNLAKYGRFIEKAVRVKSLMRR